MQDLKLLEVLFRTIRTGGSGWSTAGWVLKRPLTPFLTLGGSYAHCVRKSILELTIPYLVALLKPDNRVTEPGWVFAINVPLCFACLVSTVITENGKFKARFLWVLPPFPLNFVQAHVFKASCVCLKTHNFYLVMSVAHESASRIFHDAEYTARSCSSSAAIAVQLCMPCSWWLQMWS